MDHDKLQKLNKKYKIINVLNIISIPVFVMCILVFLYAFSFNVLSNDKTTLLYFLLFLSGISVAACFIIFIIHKILYRKFYSALEESIFRQLGCKRWRFLEKNDAYISVKSSQAVNKIDDIKYFKEDSDRLPEAVNTMEIKTLYAENITSLLNSKAYANYALFKMFEAKLKIILGNLNDYYVLVNYTSPAGKKSVSALMTISGARINELNTDKSILMTKSEYNKYVKEQGKVLLENKQHSFYERVNEVIDIANNNKDYLVNKSDADELDRLIALLFDRTVNSIKKIKDAYSVEWDVLDNFIFGIEDDVLKIVENNQRILDYYQSEDFLKIKTTCDTLMNSQKEFNEYIDEKVKTISSLFGTNIVRNETINEDEYNYIHPYKKSITPFTAEVSATVFASAENNPIDYVVKMFYPNKERYPEQIQKLQTLIEELETLKEAKQIIENYKADIQQYLTEVPSFIMENDEDGFYERLGFATINENTLVVAYKFSYTSNGGKSQRRFDIPMTEETVLELINRLESKLTVTAFTKEQRSLMTKKLREYIKERDNYTCKICGNSSHAEPNLLLEIDHITPVSKGGYTKEDNLQTLCWKCNRAKSNKMM